MRKLVLILSTLLILIALVGPGVFGFLTKRAIVDERETIERSLPTWLQLVDHKYERGWFASRSAMRLVITENAPPAVRQWLQRTAGFADQPAMLVDSVISHGPLVGVVTPGFASIDSRVRVDAGSGAPPAPLPFALQTTIGLTGNVRVLADVADGVFENGPQTFRWKDLELQLLTNAGGTVIGSKVAANAIRLEDATRAQAMEYVDIDVQLAAELRDGLTDTTVSYEVTDNNQLQAKFNGAIAVARVPQQVLPQLAELANRLMAREQQPGSAQALLARRLPVLQQALSASPTIDFVQTAAFPDGTVDASLEARLAALPGPVTSLDALLAHLLQTAEAHATFKADAILVEQPSMAMQNLVMLRGMGYLKPTDDRKHYTMDLDYVDEVFSLHGTPLPLAPMR